MRWITTIVVAIVLSSPVGAQTTSRGGALNDLKAAGGGVGATPCSEFNHSREKPEIEAMFFSWTEGYLTGWNLGLPKASQEHVDLSLMSRSEQMEFMRKWCEANPSKPYMDGTAALLIRLRASAN
jgi:hypothetical protein